MSLSNRRALSVKRYLTESMVLVPVASSLRALATLNQKNQMLPPVVERATDV
ncbi:MAG: hypothetical protein IPJ49_30820 [Candidatus Obscuribacter sp.]|nr:hypothetical protein [Candidatus Obscuribacter sp.]